jgi:uncharacterized membrane protein YphA (DoxX/SURF4 family)
MRIAVLVARVLLGLVFFAAGLSGFVFFYVNMPPPQPGLAGAFQDVFFRSHWAHFVDAAELVAGVLLLANRYVPLALTILGAVIANILFFHIAMQPQTLPIPIVVLALWIFLGWHYRSYFAGLLEQKAVPS